MRIAILGPLQPSFRTSTGQNTGNNPGSCRDREFEDGVGRGETHRTKAKRKNQSGEKFLFPEERHAMDLYHGLLARGVDVSLFPTGHNDSRDPVLDKARDEFVYCCSEPRYPSDIITTADLFKVSRDFDLIHNHSNCLPLAYAGIVKTPLLTTIHQPPHPEALPLFERANSTTYYVRTSNVGTTSQINCMATIYSGINVNSYPLRSGNSTETILFVGKLRPENGAEEALEIARLSGCKLILAGAIEDRSYVERMTAACPRESEVVDLLAVDESLRRSLYAKVDALLLPRGMDYPFMYSVLESLACGTPMISRKDDLLDEILTDGVNSYWFESIREGVSALGQTRSLSPENCRASVAERFSLDRMVDEYMKLYQEILSAHARDERRPWGYFEVLSDESDHKVKRIGVYPGKRLSLQRHRFRSEHWFMVSGSGDVTLDDQIIRLLPGQCLKIPVGAKHRMANSGDEMAVFIEVQTGSYFGEDDIERFEDDFGRFEQST